MEPIPGYRLLERIGQGSLGEVWKCEAPGGLTKAVKIVGGTDELVHSNPDGADLELQALQRVKELETRQSTEQPPAIEVAPDAFANLAGELSAAWNAPNVSMRARQQLLRTLITDIVVNVDDKTREVILTIHWRGGQHSDLRVRRPRTGEHGRRRGPRPGCHREPLPDPPRAEPEIGRRPRRLSRLVGPGPLLEGEEAEPPAQVRDRPTHASRLTR